MILRIVIRYWPVPQAAHQRELEVRADRMDVEGMWRSRKPWARFTSVTPRPGDARTALYLAVSEMHRRMATKTWEMDADDVAEMLG